LVIDDDCCSFNERFPKPFECFFIVGVETLTGSLFIEDEAVLLESKEQSI
jgi:hypothetical protein